jgi:pilus assembly protein CpaD
MIDPRRALLLTLAVLALAGCSVKPSDFEAHVADDLALRHPIELRRGWQELPIPASARVNENVGLQIGEFVADWRRFGEGPIHLRIPVGTQNDKLQKAQVARLRVQLVAHGVPGKVTLIRDEVGETGRIPVFILSFSRMKAEVVTRCGRWPANLASSADSAFENRAYTNFGCAYQSMMAAQTDDPHDLIAPRASAPIDGQMRTRAIESLRTGNDPGAAAGQKGLGGS